MADTLLTRVIQLGDRLHTIDNHLNNRINEMEYRILARLTAQEARLEEATRIRSAIIAGFWKIAAVILIWAGTGLGWREVLSLVTKQ